jgi:hypothetical protein
MSMPQSFPTAAPTPPASIGVNHAMDLTQLLDPEIAERLRKLRLRAADLHSLIPQFELRNAAATTKTESAQLMTRLQEHPSRGGFGLPPSDQRVVHAEQQLERATDEFERLEKLYNERSAAWTVAVQLVGRIEAWLRSQPGNTVLQEFDGAEPDAAPENIVAAVAKLRRRAADLRKQRETTRNAPPPAAYVRARLREQIEELSARGAPSLRQNGDIEWPQQRVQVEVLGTPGLVGWATLPDTMAMQAWLHRDAMITRLDGMVPADKPQTLSGAEREKREAALSVELLGVERNLCSLIWQAMAQKLPVEFDLDTDPCAILNVEVVTAPREAAPDTSPGLSFAMRRG